MNCILSFVFYCILLSTFVGWYSEPTLLFRLVKQHLGDHCFCNNGEVEVTFRGWLRMQGSDFSSGGIYKTRAKRGKMHQCARELRWKVIILNGLTFNIVMTSRSIFVAWGGDSTTCGPRGKYLQPSVTWTVSVIQLNEQTITGLRNIIWQVFFSREYVCKQQLIKTARSKPIFIFVLPSLVRPTTLSFNRNFSVIECL